MNNPQCRTDPGARGGFGSAVAEWARAAILPGSGLEVPVLAAATGVGPFGTDFRHGRAEPQFAPVVGRFFPLACRVVPHERRHDDDGCMGRSRNR